MEIAYRLRALIAGWSTDNGDLPDTDYQRGYMAACAEHAREVTAALAEDAGEWRLTFAELRAANIARLPQFKNRKGEPAHSQPDGSDWALSTWCNAVLGELGELANLVKKIERGDMSLGEVRGDVADELADVVTYLDILAYRCGVDLGEATPSKFNRVSERVGCDVRLPPPPTEAAP